jgi:hypothetical protein
MQRLVQSALIGAALVGASAARADAPPPVCAYADFKRCLTVDGLRAVDAITARLLPWSERDETWSEFEGSGHVETPFKVISFAVGVRGQPYLTARNTQDIWVDPRLYPEPAARLKAATDLLRSAGIAVRLDPLAGTWIVFTMTHPFGRGSLMEFKPDTDASIGSDRTLRREGALGYVGFCRRATTAGATEVVKFSCITRVTATSTFAAAGRHTLTIAPEQDVSCTVSDEPASLLSTNPQTCDPVGLATTLRGLYGDISFGDTSSLDETSLWGGGRDYRLLNR